MTRWTVEHIACKLQRNDEKIQKLRLSGVGDITGRSPMGSNAAKQLAAALRHNERCTEMDFSGNEASDTGAHHLAQALSTNVTLTSLDLSWSEIGFKGAESLSRYLGGYVSSDRTRGVDSIVRNSGRGWGNSTLTYLNLGCNKLGDRGAVAIAPALAQLAMNHVRTIRESPKDGDISPATKVFDITTTYSYRASMLSFLDLRGNGIGPLGAAALAAAIARNHTLTSLDMQGNWLGSTGSSNLAACLLSLYRTAYTPVVENQSAETRTRTAAEENKIVGETSSSSADFGLDCAVQHGGNRTLTRIVLNSNKVCERIF